MTWPRRRPIPRDDDGEPLLDAAAAAIALGVTMLTLRQWKHRGKITAAKTGPKGSSLYRMDEIARVAGDDQ
jgi:predicted site-specific integrase-resolvase